MWMTSWRTCSHASEAARGTEGSHELLRSVRKSAKDDHKSDAPRRNFHPREETMRLVGKRTFAVIGVVGILGFAAAAPAADSVDVTMAPQSGSSESGTATLTKQGNDTKVVVNLPSATGQQPAHIHKGSCSNLDPKPSYPL